MANFVRHEPCDRCGSKDNLGVYDDGSTYCFGCHAYHGPSTRTSLYRKSHSCESDRGINLPYDCSTFIPFGPLLWIEKYDLTFNDLQGNHVLWSDSRSLLIFPYYKEGQIICWQGRYFGDDAGHPKWLTKGPKEPVETIYGAGRHHPSLFLVEDVISAIKLGKLADTMPLLGCSLSMRKMLAIKKKGYKEIVFWLDRDKASSAVKQARTASMIGLSIKQVITDKDPKDLNTEYLQKTVDSI